LEVFFVSLLNGLSWGLLLFLLAGGLTLVLGMMGVLNFAHASFYMLGAYFGYQIGRWTGFWPALLLAPLASGVCGALAERFLLRRVHRQGHVAELLVTFALSYVIAELVQLFWGRSPLDYRVPEALQGTLFVLYSSSFPVYRGFMMLVAVLMLGAIAALLRHSRIGLVIRAALTQPEMVEALGHNLPRVHLLVFAAGSALAGLAGVLGGMALVTEPGMALSLGSIVFVAVVLGGLGSLAGAFVASLLIGLIQTFAVAFDAPLSRLFFWTDTTPGVWSTLSLAQVAPVLPYLLLVLVLLVRPQGLLGRRTTVLPW
jgi:branched-chain amino acid transport system permease protein